jgi:hypothetical protein
LVVVAAADLQFKETPKVLLVVAEVDRCNGLKTLLLAAEIIRSRWEQEAVVMQDLVQVP